MKLIPTTPQLFIFSVPLETLTKVDVNYNAATFDHFITNIPQLGKIEENYWLINNSLTIQNPTNDPVIHLYNIFAQASRAAGNLIQIQKPNKN